MTMKDPETGEEIYLRAKLIGLTLERFKQLKKHYGVSADAELIRILINSEYRRLFELT